MNYDIYSNNEIIASGLSNGELNQWILDLDAELKGEEKLTFRRNLGMSTEDYIEDFLDTSSLKNFENILYNGWIKTPLKISHKQDIVMIVHSDF